MSEEISFITLVKGEFLDYLDTQLFNYKNQCSGPYLRQILLLYLIYLRRDNICSTLDDILLNSILTLCQWGFKEQEGFFFDVPRLIPLASELWRC